MTYSPLLLGSLRSETKAIRVPFGDQRELVSARGPFVNCQVRPLVESTIHSVERSCSSGVPLSERTNTTFLPSGEIWGPAGRFQEVICSGDRGRSVMGHFACEGQKKVQSLRIAHAVSIRRFLRRHAHQNFLDWNFKLFPVQSARNPRNGEHVIRNVTGAQFRANLDTYPINHTRNIDPFG